MHINNISHYWVNTITSIKTTLWVHYCHISYKKWGLDKHKGDILIRGFQNKTIISFHNEPSTYLPWWSQWKYACVTYIHKQWNDNPKNLQVFQGLGKRIWHYAIITKTRLLFYFTKKTLRILITRDERNRKYLR